MALQTVRHHWMTEQQQISSIYFSKPDRSSASLCEVSLASCPLFPWFPLLLQFYSAHSALIPRCSLLDSWASSVLHMTLYSTPLLWQTPFKSSSRAQQSTPLLLWSLLLPAPPPLKTRGPLSLAITFGARSESWVMPHLWLLAYATASLWVLLGVMRLIWHCHLSS